MRADSLEDGPSHDGTMSTNSGHTMREDTACNDMKESPLGSRGSTSALGRLQTELTRVSRVNAMAVLSSALVHDLNQPMTAAINYVQAAQMMLKPLGENAPEDVRSFLGKAVEQLDRVSDLVKGLGGIAGPEPGRSSPEDVEEIVKTAVSLARASTEEPQRGITLELHRTPPAIRIDRPQLIYVLFNLVQNALEATAGLRGGHVMVVTKMPDADHLEIIVTDNGPGLPPDMRENPFKPCATSKKAGLGLGLATCHRAIIAMGGQITLDRLHHRGTAFHISLPLTDRGPLDHA